MKTKQKNIYNNEITYVIPTYNNFEDLINTLDSLLTECLDSDEIIVIDSSDNKEEVILLISKYKTMFKIAYHWIAAAGVYAAHNYGISNAKYSYISIINSGDFIVTGGRKYIADAIEKYEDIPIFVFSQLDNNVCGEPLKFIPNKNSFWPHQSTLIHRSVYDHYGAYDIRFRVVADQIYLNRIRHFVKYRIIDKVLTINDVTGISSKIYIKNLVEYYKSRRIFGLSVFRSLIDGVLFPVLRVFVSSLLRPSVANWLKVNLKNGYSLVRE